MTQTTVGSTPAPGMMVTPTVRLVERLGQGGMGSVWVADHLALRTRVVVKFMAEELAAVPTAVERFSREAAAASQVKSPHVVQMLDHGISAGRPYIVMELLEGRDLDAHLAKTGPLAPAAAVSIVAQLARALGKAHALGIVHRDVKPSNIFLLDTGDSEPFVKLLDFGVAKASTLAIGHTTESGSFLGSPLYMSPEQLLGQKVIDARADLWAVGVVAFEMLTGQRPFVAETVAGLALRIHQDAPPTLTALCPSLPVAVDAWFARACARDPAGRFATARELAEAFADALGFTRGAADPSFVGASPAAFAPTISAGPAALPPASENAGELALARTAARPGTRDGGGRRSVVPLAVAAAALAVGLGVGVWGRPFRAEPAGASGGGSAVVPPRAPTGATLTAAGVFPPAPVSPAVAASPAVSGSPSTDGAVAPSSQPAPTAAPSRDTARAAPRGGGHGRRIPGAPALGAASEPAPSSASATPHGAASARPTTMSPPDDDIK